MACWQWCRVFHSKRNWLGKQTMYKVQTPYSSSTTFFSCMIPISCLICLLVYIAFTATDESREDADHPILIKDADVHWRLSDKYYRHFYDDLNFHITKRQKNIDDDGVNFGFNPNTNFTATLYQMYRPGDDQRNWDCTKFIDKNPRQETLNYDNDFSANASLCYHKRVGPTSYNNIGQGLYLCLDEEDEFGLKIEIEKQKNVCCGNDKIWSQIWRSGESIIITLQLYVLWDWNAVTMGSEPVWEDNVFEVKNVEYQSDKFYVCNDVEGYDCTQCHGIQIRMDRIVYEIQDGTNGYATIGAVLALFGGAYSFILLLHAGCAVCADNIAFKCCRDFYNEELKLAVHEDNIEEKLGGNVQMGTATPNDTSYDNN